MAKEAGQKKTLDYIARENMRDLVEEVNERGIQQKDIVGIAVKGSSFNLLYYK